MCSMLVSKEASQWLSVSKRHSLATAGHCSLCTNQ